MAIYLPDGLPALEQLRQEGRVAHALNDRHKVSPERLRILLLNLMPDKPGTELQFARRLSESGFPVELVLLRPASHVSKNTPEAHFEAFYKTWPQVEDDVVDGLIVTGAPVEHLEFSEVNYWAELRQIFTASRRRKLECLFICWAAQAALQHFYRIPKRALPRKAFGVFEQQLLKFGSPSLEGMGAQFPCPVSRYSETSWCDVSKVDGIEVAAGNSDTGIFLLEEREIGALYMFNHLEYDAGTLAREYERDLQILDAPILPANYFPFDNPKATPACTWDEAASTFFRNWLRMTARRRMAQGMLTNAA